jgi:hypothetical protein
MNWKLWLVSACVAMVGLSCGPQMVDPVLELTATPRSIRSDGQKSVLSITATDNVGKPGTGSVRVRSTIGSLREAATVQLANGVGEIDFTCSVATDTECRGSARISAEWTSNMKLVETSASVSITTVVADAGSDGGADAGVDAGSPADAGADGGSDAGMPLDGGAILDAGSFDGGFFGMYRLSVVDVEKPTLLSGVSDQVNITFLLTLNSAFMNPIANTQATITVDQGTSLAAGMAMASTTRMTDANGRFTVTVYSGTVGRATISVVATALDAQVTQQLRSVSVASAEWLTDPTTRNTLAVSSTGDSTSTPVFFRVKDAQGMPVEGVDVQFSIAANSAAGCTVLPLRDRSNALGIVRTTLNAGDSQGTATVIAKVLSLPDTPSPGFNIVIGRVNEGRMQLSCNRTTLGALQWPTPPRIDQNAQCTVVLADRNGLNPPFALNVSFQTEAGSIPPTITSTPGATSVSAMFNTGGSLPVPTSPLPAIGPPFNAPAEPFSGINNPRDSFVTIIAAVQGEEEFWDGSGSSNGLANGQWEPGEYWVDLPEPFVDSNDNGTWDPNEPFIDTDRVNCGTGQVEPKNSRWDRPNGCWDRRTQIWKTTHIVYGAGPGPATPDFLRFSPAIPSFVPNDAVRQVTVTWTDAFFNRFSSDSAAITITQIAGSRGSAAISTSGITGESFGHDLRYFAVRALVSDAGVVVAEEGLCDPLAPDSGYPDIRCLRTYRFRDWRTTPPTVTMTLVGPTAQTPINLPDGGMMTPPATNATWELRAANSLQAGPSSYQFTVSFP